MSNDDSKATTSEDEEQQTDSRDGRDNGDQRQDDSYGDIDLSEEGREEVRQMAEAYKDKPTAVLPGSDGTITGTAINDWLDDEGNPKFGDPDEHPCAQEREEGEGDGSKEASEDRS